MAGGVSYLSRFWAKFVEVLGAGLASTVMAFMLAHFGGIWLFAPAQAPAPPAIETPVPAATASQAPATRAVGAADLNEQRPSEQRSAKQEADTPAAQPPREAAKPAKSSTARAHSRTDRSDANTVEKKPGGDMSAEALARAALANIDANRAADRQPPAQPRPTPGANPSHSPVFRPGPASPVDVQSRAVTAGDPLPPANAHPLEISAPPRTPATEDAGVFAAFKRIPDLLRPDPPAPPARDTLRPPLPVGTTSTE